MLFRPSGLIECMVSPAACVVGFFLRLLRGSRSLSGAAVLIDLLEALRRLKVPGRPRLKALLFPIRAVRKACFDTNFTSGAKAP